MLKTNLPQLLEDYQNKYGLTQYQLGELVGMQQGAINKFMKNKAATNISLITLARICEVIEIDLGNIIKESE